MFSEKSFAVFSVEGLEERMTAIRQEIQPQFQEIGSQISENLAVMSQKPFYLHIAQHRRRSVHPPENTWAGIGENKRGYKMAPHFQLGIWPEYVFMWLSIIDQPKKQKEYGEILATELPQIESLPKDFVVNFDHTVKDYFPLTEASKGIESLIKVKKAEFQIGSIIPRDSSLWQDQGAALGRILQTYQELWALYQALTKD